MKPKLKPPTTKRLKLKCDLLLSTAAFKYNLRRYNEDSLPISDFYFWVWAHRCTMSKQSDETGHNLSDVYRYTMGKQSDEAGPYIRWPMAAATQNVEWLRHVAGGSFRTSTRPTLIIL